MSKTINKNPCIICVAITGSVPTKKNNPNIPISVNEQIESTQQAFEAGEVLFIVMLGMMMVVVLLIL